MSPSKQKSAPAQLWAGAPQLGRCFAKREPHMSAFNGSCSYQAPSELYSSQSMPATITKPFQKTHQKLNFLSFETNLDLTIDRKQ